MIRTEVRELPLPGVPTLGKAVDKQDHVARAYRHVMQTNGPRVGEVVVKFHASEPKQPLQTGQELLRYDLDLGRLPTLALPAFPPALHRPHDGRINDRDAK